MKKRKNKLIKLTKIGILLFGISLFLWNCEKEYFLLDNSLENASDSKIDREKVNLNKLTKVNEILKTLKRKKQKEKSSVSGVIFFDDVIKLKDSLNIVNYTIKFKFFDTPKGIFYNLILGQDKEGAFKTPYVIKYLCDQSNVELLYQNNLDWRYFKGKIEFHKYTDYFSLGYFSKTLIDCPQDVDSNGNPIPCDSQEVTGGSGGDIIDNDNIDNVGDIGDNGAIGDTNTDSLDSNSESTGGGGITSQCSFQDYVLGCGGPNTNTLHLHSECGPNPVATTQHYNIMTCYAGFEKTATDCPDCDFDPDGAIELSIADDDKIDASELTGKAECVYNKMIDNNNNINWILKNFKDGDKPSEFDLKFVMATDLGDETNATTVKSGNTFTISINANTLPSRTSLGLARTIIHEGIHARLREFASRSLSNAVSFPGVYDYFRIYKQNWDHQQMADYYRGTIAKGLKQYDNGQHSDQFYNDLSWEGLANIKDANGVHDQIYTEAWKKLTLAEKKRIKNTITDEKDNGNKNCQ